MTVILPESESVESTGRAEWLQQRRTGIGGSDVAAIIGLSRWKTPRDVWLEKIGRRTGDEVQPNRWAIARGNALEGPLLGWFTEETGLPVVPVPMQRNTSRPWMLGSLDGGVTTGDNGPTGIVEAKTASWHIQRLEWADGAADYAELQLQWYMAVTGLQRGWIIAALGDDDPVITEHARDDALISHLIEAAEHFRETYVLPNVEPPAQWQDRDVIAAEHPHSEPETVAVADESAAHWVAERQALDAQIKALDKDKQQAEAEVIKALGDCEALVLGDRTIATRKEQQSRVVDNAAIAAALADAGDDIDNYRITRTTRVLRFPKEK